MTCRTDVADGFTYRLCPDAPPALADRMRAVVQWTAIDEVTQKAPNVDFSLSTPVLGLKPRVASDGVMGLVGNPGRLFPNLGALPVDIPFDLAAPGYIGRALQATLGPIPGFPDAFAPSDLGTVFLHRNAIVLRGRVAQRTGIVPTPLAGVRVTLAGVWLAEPDTVLAPPTLVSLHPGIYADRTGGVDALRRRDLVLAVGEDKKLVLPAVVGDTTVRVSDAINLAPGTILAFEPSLADRVEYVPISAVRPGATNDEPAYIDLTHPLAVAHEQGTVCVRAIPQVPAASNTFTRDAIPHDGVAFLASLTGIVEGSVVEIAGGTPSVEYQVARLYDTVSDPQGYYRMPPIARVASVQLHATRLGLSPQDVVRSLEYDRYENLTDVIFP